MGKKKKTEYYCIKKDSFLPGVYNAITVDYINNNGLFGITKRLKHMVTLWPVSQIKNLWLIDSKLEWIIPAPEHAIVAAKLRGEI